jgi:hypothetical protein
MLRCNLRKIPNPAEPDKSATVTLTHKVDKSLYSGIIYAKSVDNSDTVTKLPRIIITISAAFHENSNW